MRLIQREHSTRGNGEAFSPSNTTGSLFHMAQLPPVALPKARLRLQENSDFFLKKSCKKCNSSYTGSTEAGGSGQRHQL